VLGDKDNIIGSTLEQLVTSVDEACHVTNIFLKQSLFLQYTFEVKMYYFSVSLLFFIL